MKTPQTSITSIFALVLMLLLAGCQQLRPGYYLTPENFPTPAITRQAAGEEAAQLPAETPTPVSTMRGLETATPTPLPPETEAPTATATPYTCEEASGRIVQESFVSGITGAEFHYEIYLPPCYDITGKRYPTLYMLHGLGAGMDDTQWDRMGLDEADAAGYIDGSLPPMIIVMPDGTDASHGLHGASAPFPEVVYNELIPHVDQWYCTWDDPEMRAIGGLSRGGFWAYWIAFSHPDTFSRVGGHSAYLFESDYSSDKNPFNIALTAEGIESLAMYLDHGGEGRELSEVRPGIQQFLALLAQRGIEPIYVENDSGDHDESYWAAHVNDYLAFYGTDWPRDAQQLPTCSEPSPVTDD